MALERTKGSQWRRWDMHLHTPFTKKNDQFRVSEGEDKWGQFYKVIADYVGDGSNPLTAISAVAITDYLSVDNYLKIKKDDKLPDCIKLCLPCIEMRMIPIAANRPVNIHAFFSPDIDGEIETRFLGKLAFSYNGSTYSASKTDLIRLGKDCSTNQKPQEEKAYRIGIDQFVLTLGSIESLFNNDRSLREKVIIAVSNKNSDGASGLNAHSDYFTDGTSQLDSTRQQIYRLSDMILSSNPKDIAYFLGESGSDDASTVKRKCGSLKPCIHGCDAHSYERIFNPDEERFCWIKAEPTFEGLKQTLYEPKDRVRISSTIPENKQGYNVIERIEITGNEDFCSSPIYFNDNLTCIIGGKSTGKSLLLHNIAKTIDPNQTDKKSEVATHKIRPINEMSIIWKDGQIDNGGMTKLNPRKIVYIPQTYLNRLSDEKEKTTDIDMIIQNIVLQNGDARNAFSIRCDAIENLKQRLAKYILDIVAIDADIKNSILARKNIGDKSGIENEIIKIKKEIELLSSNSSITDEEIKKYQNAVSQHQILTGKIESLNVEINNIQKLEEIFKQ